MHKISKQTFQGHVTHTIPILMTFFLIFFQNYIVLLFAFLTSVFLHFGIL